MRKLLSVILSLCMLFSLSLTACAADTNQNETTIVLKIGSPTMTANGEVMPIDEQGTVPVIVDDRTLLPVRAIVEKLGGTVGWDGESQTVTLQCGEDEIRMVIGSTSAFLNSEEKTLDVAPAVINDRTMLPIRFIAEGFQLGVAWNEAEQEVTITKTTAAEAPAEEPAEKPEETPAPEPTDKPAEADQKEAEENKALIVYFSATGTTKALAETIAEATGADIVEIEPEVPYTSADLNYSNDNCRANLEQHDDSARPAIANQIENIDEYDTIFLGYPIWWGTMPKIINTFLETYDLSGKTIMPFCTSGGSGIGTSVSAIKSTCQGADVRDGLRGSSSTTEKDINAWIEE